MIRLGSLANTVLGNSGEVVCFRERCGHGGPVYHTNYDRISLSCRSTIANVRLHASACIPLSVCSGHMEPSLQKGRKAVLSGS